MLEERRGGSEPNVGSTSCSAQDVGRPSSHQPQMNHCASPGVGCFHQEECGKGHLDMLEVLQLGDGCGQHALAQVARHQLSVYTSHQAQICNIFGFGNVADSYGYGVLSRSKCCKCHRFTFHK